MGSPKKFGVLSCEVSQGLGYLSICFLSVVHEAGIKLAGLEKTLDFVSILGWSCFLDRVRQHAGLGETGAKPGH